MLNILVDESYAFDYLSILEIKMENRSSVNAMNSWVNCYDYMQMQLGDKFHDVYGSAEYKALKAANLNTFNAVEIARNGGVITAKAVDDANNERYYAKVALQNKFFGANMVEQKTSLNKS